MAKLSTPSDRPTCSTCGYFNAPEGRCQKDPKPIDKHPNAWCGQHTAYQAFLQASEYHTK